jgi:hypothetical protein
MAEIHVQARRQQRSNPAWMWTWIIIGVLIIAAVAYFVYTKGKETQTNEQEIKNDRNTPVPGAAIPHQDETYRMNAVA